MRSAITAMSKPDAVEKASDEARAVMQQLQQHGISLDEVTYELVVDGVKLFADAFDKLLGAVSEAAQDGGDSGTSIQRGGVGRCRTLSSDRPVRCSPCRPGVEAQPPGPCAMVIFGAGGDLTKRLLFPALYNLARTKLLPENFAIIGADLADRSVEDWRNSLLDMLRGFVGNTASESDLDAIDPSVWDKLSKSMSYVQGDMRIQTCTTSSGNA